MDYLVNDSELTSIANAIRTKGGTSASLAFPSAFVSAINDIPTGGGGEEFKELLEKTISIASGSVSMIGAHTFYNCTRLTSASFPVCTTIGAYTFYSCYGLTSVSFPACTLIDAYAFEGCSRLTTASFPVCTSIGSNAFSRCYSLTSISFPVCTTIESNAFKNCSKLTSISFPVCTSIAASAFSQCANLTTASFPACDYIGNYAFASCYNLLSLYLLGSSVPTLRNTNAFNSTPISNYTTSTGGVRGSIIVQASMLDTFKTATNWSVYSARFSVWNGTD